MRKCLADANVCAFLIEGNIPEKMVHIWKQITGGTRTLLLIEPVVSEVYYKNVPKFGKKVVKDKILWLKALKSAEEYRLDDNDAMLAGSFKVERSGSGLSIVDCYIIAVAKRTGSLILTTDKQIRNVAKENGVQLEYIPFGKK